jgi:tRNA-Thr(GGU) m(6)t(6)A37 methyltransferase TsaA
MSASETSLVLEPIGVVRSGLYERSDAPRQPGTGGAHAGRIELFDRVGMVHALDDLDRFDHIWVLFWFHKNQGWRPKVLPPRNQKRRGVFATRSPYRPNPIGLSVVRLLGIDGLTLQVTDLDILDGSPVLDLKPYLPYADALPQASSGWLDAPERDPLGSYSVSFTDHAQAQFDFLQSGFGLDLQPRVRETLQAGAEPRPYRRIRRVEGGLVLAYKTWRFSFQLTGRDVVVTNVSSGIRPSQLASAEEAEPHRALLERFGPAP